ncbi:MAG: Dyp-type peroxidase [Gammaproteobacteria bacterium]|jgi:putative iron-dependent peroxidase|nr:Dyp-type peroxidase [Gammaproteobacteria bacterium]MDX2462679.1 Dyp-type peroxidase [Gammaproteobacteria bacterium]
MTNAQPGILEPVPRLARYLTFSQCPQGDARTALAALAEGVDGQDVVVGIGQSLALHLGCAVDGLRVFSAHACSGFEVPSTPAALWCWIRGDDRGDILHRSWQLQRILAPAFDVEEIIDAFQYRSSLDLTGYEDGTENPQGDDALEAAIVGECGSGADGSSFVAVQQWVHDLELFESKPADERDNIIGRRQSDNEELAEAPESAHVKRTAQESFEPEAFVLRRSMPWADEFAAGLNFVAFGKSFDAFEAQLVRMTGAEDGIVDALFSFTRPVSGAYFWCPPLKSGQLDLSLLKM